MRFGKSPSFGLLVVLVGHLACDPAPVSTPQPDPAAELVPAEAPGQAVPAARRLAPPEFLARGNELAAPEAPESSCPEGMLLVEGRYCPNVEQRCSRYLDPPGRYHEFRCAEYAEPTCASRERRLMRFCIDRDEYSDPGEHLPKNHQSFTHAKQTCTALGKRVCQESEWNFACEGEQMLAYPYGMKRDPSACNADRTDIVGPTGALRDLRAPAEAFPRCVSPFGVRNLAGNLEEFVALDGPGPERPAMKGAYWQPSRNFCRAKQTAHDRFYNGTETGFRCCADAPETP